MVPVRSTAEQRWIILNVRFHPSTDVTDQGALVRVLTRERLCCYPWRKTYRPPSSREMEQGRGGPLCRWSSGIHLLGDANVSLGGAR